MVLTNIITAIVPLLNSSEDQNMLSGADSKDVFAFKSIIPADFDQNVDS